MIPDVEGDVAYWKVSFLPQNTSWWAGEIKQACQLIRLSFCDSNAGSR